MNEIIRNLIENTTLNIYYDLLKNYFKDIYNNVIPIFISTYKAYPVEFWYTFFGVFIVIGILVMALCNFLFNI